MTTPAPVCFTTISKRSSQQKADVRDHPRVNPNETRQTTPERQPEKPRMTSSLKTSLGSALLRQQIPRDLFPERNSAAKVQPENRKFAA
jgi:hypothetical protein